MNNMRGNQEDSISSHLQRRGMRPSYSVDSMPGVEPEASTPPSGPPPSGGGGFYDQLMGNTSIPHEMKAKLMELFSKGGDSTSFNQGLYSEDYRGMDHDFKGTLAGLYDQGQSGSGSVPAGGPAGIGGPVGRRRRKRGAPQTSTGRPNEMGGGRRQVSDLPVVEDSMTRGPEGMGSEEVGPSTPKPSGMKPPQRSSTTPPKFRNFRGGAPSGNFGPAEIDPNKAKMLEYLKSLGMK